MIRLGIQTLKCPNAVETLSPSIQLARETATSDPWIQGIFRGHCIIYVHVHVMSMSYVKNLPEEMGPSPLH